MTPDFVRQPGRLARSLAAGALCAAICTPLLAADRLSLCFENKNVMPWRSLAREGLNFEMLKRVEARLGIVFHFESLPWKRCLAKLKANEVDGAFTVSYTDERRQYGAFPGNGQADAKKRMHFARYFLIRKKGSAIDWDGKQFSHLDGKIGHQLGYSVGEFLEGLHVPADESSDSPYNMARKVLNGRLAGAAMFDSDVRELMLGPLAPHLEKLATPLVERAYYLILSNVLVKARPELAERIWKSVEEVRNGREYGRLVQAAGVESTR
jgi:polar amino acid transport system substrate-binding protein